MDTEVEQALVNCGFEPVEATTKFYCVGSSPTISRRQQGSMEEIYENGAMTVLVKKRFAEKAVPGGRVVAVRPETFDLDFSHADLRDFQSQLAEYHQEYRVNKKPNDIEERIGSLRDINPLEEDQLISAIRRSLGRTVSTAESMSIVRYKTKLDPDAQAEPFGEFAQSVIRAISEAADKARTEGYKYGNAFGIYPKHAYYYIYFEPNTTSSGK